MIERPHMPTPPRQTTLRRLANSLELRLIVPLAAVIAIVLALHAFLGYWGVREQVAGFVRSDLERSTSLIQNAMHDGMLLNRMDEVQSRLERLGASPGFTSIRIYAKDGTIALSSSPSERGRIATITDDACSACHPGAKERGPGVLMTATIINANAGHDIQRSISVIRNEPSCSAMECHPPPSQRPVLGVLDVQMSMAPFDNAIAHARQQVLWTTFLLILASGLIVALFIRKLIHAPVARLYEGTHRIAAGDLSTHINVQGTHELATLAHAFNAMVADLNAAHHQLDQWSRTLEQRVEEKTLALRQTQQRMVQVETMASLGKLAATVAHELNNPLSGVLAYARLVRRELDEQPIEAAVRADLESYLALIDKECVRCTDIVKNLLTFARGSAVRLAETDLNQIIQHCLMLVRHHLELHHIRLESVPFQGDATLIADQGQLHQVVLALLMNAIEAMHANGQRPAILRITLDADATSLTLRIHDTGVGIHADLIPHIFEPFVTTKGATSGVGLGLAVVYGVIQSHEGQISVDSAVNLGTTFTVTLPRQRASTPTSPLSERADS